MLYCFSFFIEITEFALPSLILYFFSLLDNCKIFVCEQTHKKIPLGHCIWMVVGGS